LAGYHIDRDRVTQKIVGGYAKEPRNMQNEEKRRRATVRLDIAYMGPPHASELLCESILGEAMFTAEMPYFGAEETCHRLSTSGALDSTDMLR
jgi:hypothetical protein